MTRTGTKFEPLSYVDLTEQTYRVLKDKILKFELKPGEQIAVADVALALGVSRTPVTDALKRLASEDLVEIVARQGTFVTQLTTRDIDEIFEMRLMIERYAAESVIEAGKAQQYLDLVRPSMAGMQSAIDGDHFRDYETFTIYDRDFHTTLVTLTGNNRLVRAYHQLHVHTHGARVHYLDGGNVPQTQREHAAILDAFAHPSVEHAKAALTIHIAAVKARILEFLEARGGKL